MQIVWYLMGEQLPQTATEGVIGHVQLPVGQNAGEESTFDVRIALYIAAFIAKGMETSSSTD